MAFRLRFHQHSPHRQGSWERISTEETVNFGTEAALRWTHSSCGRSDNSNVWVTWTCWTLWLLLGLFCHVGPCDCCWDCFVMLDPVIAAGTVLSCWTLWLLLGLFCHAGPCDCCWDCFVMLDLVIAAGTVLSCWTLWLLLGLFCHAGPCDCCWDCALWFLWWAVMNKVPCSVLRMVVAGVPTQSISFNFYVTLSNLDWCR